MRPLPQGDRAPLLQVPVPGREITGTVRPGERYKLELLMNHGAVAQLNGGYPGAPPVASLRA